MTHTTTQPMFDRTESSISNPIISIILKALRTYPGGFDEYTLIKAIEAEGLFELLSEQPDLRLFQKHFITMNALYQTQHWLRETLQQELYISALTIKLEKSSESESCCDHSLAAISTAQKLAEYYLDWSHFNEASPDYVANLLNDFWQRYINPDKISTALALLELDNSTVDKKTIKRQFQILASRHHPDKGGDQNTFIAIREAYEILIQ